MKLINKYKVLIGLFCLILFCIFAHFYGKSGRENIKANGIYTIAKVDKIEVAGRTGWYCYFHFSYRNTIYKKKCIANSKVGDCYFIVIIPDNLDEYVLLNSNKVPSWFTAEAPVEGWKTKPTDEELRAIQNKADSIKAIKN